MRRARRNSRPFGQTVLLISRIKTPSSHSAVVGDGGCEAYTVIGWGGGLSHERKNVAEAETYGSVEGNMCGIAMRDAVAPPGSKATSRPKGTRRNLRDLMSGHRLQSRLVRIGKVRSRSR